MTSRRHFLQGAGLALAGLSSMGTGAVRRSLPPDVNRKFAPNGRVIPFRGNTILCHVPQQGPEAEAFHGLMDVYRQLPSYAFSRKMTPMPPSSYHMTIFGGANDQERRLPLWPADVALDAPMEECNRLLGERLRAFTLGEDAPPYRMKVNPAEPSSAETPLTIRLLAADPQTETRLRRLRARLSDLLKIRAPGQAEYAFHITLGYTFDWLTPGEDAEFRSALARWKAMLTARAPVITFGAPEYCILDDMYEFSARSSSPDRRSRDPSECI